MLKARLSITAISSRSRRTRCIAGLRTSSTSCKVLIGRMKTMTRTIEQENFDHETQRIRVGVSTILKKRGLVPRFKRWRLAKDPDTGMVVLFGVLNNGYIAAHTSIPFRDYFDPRVLHDLANQLQVQVVSCNTDGLRYAFILDRGRLDSLPTHIDFPYVNNGKLSFRVVYPNSP